LCSYATPALATAGTDAGTTAVVGGGANVPVVECAWALNDVDHNWSGPVLMQYGQDDSTATPGSPCVVDGDGAKQLNNNPVPMIHVLPNADDSPTQAWVELWGAVTSSNTANTIVYWDIYHPGPNGDGTGSFKVQVDGSRYADSSSPGKCNDDTVTGPMFGAAKSTGQMTTGAATNIIAECKFQQKSLWYGAFGISKHQPWGLYRIVLHAAVAGGVETTFTYYIYVQPFFQLEKDFTTINFGSVGPNSHNYQPVPGDFDWNGTNNASNQASTVRNTGNAGMGLSLKFASMCLSTAASCTDDKRIDHFDAKYGKIVSDMQTLGPDFGSALVSDLSSTAKPAPYGPQYDFDNTINRTLCPNDPAKIEFSIYTENIQAGVYDSNGTGIRLIGRGNPICPTDNGEPYNAPKTPTSNTHHNVV
jgi:hypothetical protein